MPAVLAAGTSSLLVLGAIASGVVTLGTMFGQLTRRVPRRRVVGAMLVRDLLIATFSVLFSLWVTFAAGYQAVYQALLLLLVGIPIYAFLKARKERLGQVPEPDETLSDAGAADGTIVPLAR
jgi:APA family basic amino acid/polyamine antiporter